MTLGERLALTHPWWMWPHPRIVEAIARVHLEEWLPRYQAQLRDNERSGRSPTRKNIACDLYLCRDQRNVERMTTDARQLSSQLLLGLSYSLALPITDFFPTWHDWIAGAAARLIQEEGEREPAPFESLAYAHYRFHNRIISLNGAEPTLEANALEKAWLEQRCAFSGVRLVEKAVLKVVSLLGPILERLVKR